MSLLLKNGQVYYKNKLQNLDILIENDQIKKIENDISDNAEEIKDCSGLTIFQVLLILTSILESLVIQKKKH